MRDSANLPIIKRSVGPEWNGKQGHWDKTSWPKSFIVIHTIVGTLKGADAVFNTPFGHKYFRNASANYGIGLNGDIWQWVSERFTAYANTNYVVNQRAISIEHEDNWNGDPKTEPKRPDALYASSARLVADICRFWNIPCTREFIRKHSEVSKTATACPDALDIDRIVREAKALLDQNVTPVVQISDDDRKRSLEALETAFKTLKKDDNQPFGNLEGMTRALVDNYASKPRLSLSSTDTTLPIADVSLIGRVNGSIKPQKSSRNFVAKVVDWMKGDDLV